MTFVAMAMPFVIFIFTVVCCICFTGFIILVASIIQLRKSRKQGTEPKKYGIAIGMTMLFLPNGIVTLCVMCGLLVGTLINIWNLHYNNFADKWRSEYILSSTARKDVMRGFIKAADKGDKEKIMSMFTKNIQKDENLSAQVDEFLKDYPGGLYGLEYEDYSNDIPFFGEETFDMSTEVVKDGTTYYLDFGGRCHDEDNKDDVGLEYFFVKSERGEVLEYDVKAGEKPDIEKSKYIASEINVDGDFTVKRIGGILYKYYEMDRKLTESDVVTAVKISDTVSDLEENLGKPNSNNVRYTNLVYEIEPENGEPRYIVVGYDSYDVLFDEFLSKKSEEDDYSEDVEVP